MDFGAIWFIVQNAFTDLIDGIASFNTTGVIFISIVGGILVIAVVLITLVLCCALIGVVLCILLCICCVFCACGCVAVVMLCLLSAGCWGCLSSIAGACCCCFHKSEERQPGFTRDVSFPRVGEKAPIEDAELFDHYEASMASTASLPRAPETPRSGRNPDAVVLPPPPSMLGGMQLENQTNTLVFKPTLRELEALVTVKVPRWEYGYPSTPEMQERYKDFMVERLNCEAEWNEQFLLLKKTYGL